MPDRLQAVHSPLFDGIARDDLSAMLNCEFASMKADELIDYDKNWFKIL